MTQPLSNTALRAGLLATAAILGFAALPSAAVAQEAPAAGQTKGEDIVVIGTRRLDRTSTNSASPIDVISAKTLSTQASSNLIDSINNIVPSFYVGQNSISDASTFVRAPSLRGLPGDETLVMLDGKRYNRSALVQVYTGGDTGLSFGSQGADLQAIPTIAIANLDVLRDGAAEQYGSDAIAGVLNFGLKKNRKGIEIDAKYGQYFDKGDGKSKEISATAGFALGDRGYADFSGEYDDDGGTSRGVTRVLAYDLAHPQAGNTLAAADPGFTSPNQIPNYPAPAQIWGSSPNHGYKLLFNGGFDVSANSKVYLIVNVAHISATESFNYRAPVGINVVDPSHVTNVDQSGVTHSLSANGSFGNINCSAADIAAYPTACAGGVFNFKSIYPGGFTPQFVGVTDEAWGTIGYKGKTDSGLTYDLSGSLSRNSLTLSMYNSLNASYGPESQTSFNFGQLIQREVDVNLDMSYPIQVGLASPLTVAWGGEYREETYTQTAGDVQSYAAGPYAAQGFSPAASGYGGTSPNAAGTWSQSDFAGYLDLETDLLKNLSVGAAARYEHYNTFGDATVGKINAIYTIVPEFKIRGSLGTGFHAPSPGQSHDEILTTNFVAGNQVQTGTYPVDSAIAQYYGAKALTPEKSVNVGLGFVAKPTRDFTLTVDAYSVKVKNRIFITENYTVSAADIVAQPSLASVGAGGAINFFTNGLDTLTKGIEVVGAYHKNLGSSGILDLTLAYTHNENSVSRSNSNVISAAQILDVVYLSPRDRATMTANWSLGPLNINAQEHYYGSWADAVDYPGDATKNFSQISLTTPAGVATAQKFGAKLTTDLSVSYTIAKHYTLSFGGTDIFNTKPDKIANSGSNPIYPVTGGTADGQVYPRLGGPFGFNGGYWYARLKINY